MQDVLEVFRRERVSAILRTGDASAVVPAMEAAVRGGFRIVEFTLTTPGALEAIAEFSRREGILAGAGTVLSGEQARSAVAAGAKFLVSPVTDPEVIRIAAALGVAAMPGAHTPTELLLAHRCGAPLQKLFPAPAGGPAWLRAVMGPLPGLRVVPTNGVDEQNVQAWFDAGAYGAGFVGNLFDAEEMAARQFDRIEARARRLIEAAGRARA